MSSEGIQSHKGKANETEHGSAAGKAYSSQQMANENLTKPYIVSAIEAKRSELMADKEDKVAWLIGKLEAEATAEGNTDSTRVRALELLLKVHGGFAPEKTEITSFDGTFLADLDEDPVQKVNETSELH